jgi:hypothetical protein
MKIGIIKWVRYYNSNLNKLDSYKDWVKKVWFNFKIIPQPFSQKTLIEIIDKDYNRAI